MPYKSRHKITKICFSLIKMSRQRISFYCMIHNFTSKKDAAIVQSYKTEIYVSNRLLYNINLRMAKLS